MGNVTDFPASRCPPIFKAWRKSCLRKHRENIDYSRLPEVAPKISASIDKDATTGNQFKGTYKFDVNINPVPFGYPHNQYELLSAHPFHGDHSIRITLLVQWLLVYLFLFFFNRKWLAREAKP